MTRCSWSEKVAMDQRRGQAAGFDVGKVAVEASEEAVEHGGQVGYPRRAAPVGQAQGR